MLYCFILIYFNKKPLHVSSSLAAHHEEDQFCINSKWYSHALCWVAAASQHNGWLHQLLFNRIDPPDNEQQDCWKHVEAYYWNKLTENSACCWFKLYGCIRMTPRVRSFWFSLRARWHNKLTQIPVPVTHTHTHTHTEHQTFHLDSGNSQNQRSAGVSNKPLAELSAACWSTIACNRIPYSMDLIG